MRWHIGLIKNRIFGTYKVVLDFPLTLGFFYGKFYFCYTKFHIFF